MGLKMKATGSPNPPRNTHNTSLEIQQGKVRPPPPHQPADSWPSGDIRGLGEGCPTMSF